MQIRHNMLESDKPSFYSVSCWMRINSQPSTVRIVIVLVKASLALSFRKI
jgi:hypothetical protein